MNELSKRKESVGILDGSFVEGTLLSLKFDKLQIKKYTSPEELHELFVKGSANGGISTAFDDIPYINLFLSKYCGKYTTVKPKFKTDGFGFVFAKGSPLMSDVSTTILHVTQGDEMEQIQNKWFKSDDSCPNVDSVVSSTRLDLESFWGLFLLAGIASVAALIAFVAMFLYDQRHVLFEFHPGTSVWRKVGIMSRIFDQKELSSHTFKKTVPKDASGHCNVHDVGVAESSSNTNCPPSPSSLSDQTDDSDFIFIVEQGSNTSSPNASPSPERSIELSDYRQEDVHGDGDGDGVGVGVGVSIG